MELKERKDFYMKAYKTRFEEILAKKPEALWIVFEMNKRKKMIRLEFVRDEENNYNITEINANCNGFSYRENAAQLPLIRRVRMNLCKEEILQRLVDYIKENIFSIVNGDCDIRIGYH